MAPTLRGIRPLATLLLVLLAVCSSGSRAGAQERAPIRVKASEMEPMTFARIVLRVRSTGEIAFSGEELRVEILEALRRQGYPALGAESLVFDRDKADQAKIILGATVTELDCMIPAYGVHRCLLGVQWEVLDRASDRVIYRVVTRSVRQGEPGPGLGAQLIWGNFGSLLSRPKFVEAMKKRRSGATSSLPHAAFARCSVGDRPMPGSTKSVLGATVLIESGERLGSGVLVSADGFVLTAAHVIDPRQSTTVQFDGSAPLRAVVVRMHESSDVALLRLESGRRYPCAELKSNEPTVGDDVFAIGSPLGKELSFSLTRGIVSGVRRIEGETYLQTDASINRGNSGGPLIDASGRIAAIVTWKVADTGVEGIAFGVPVRSALAALSVRTADSTDERLSFEQVAAVHVTRGPVDDTPDPVQGIRPPPRTYAPPPADSSGGSPAKGLRTGGVALATVGAIGIVATWSIYSSGKETMSTEDYEQLRTYNDASWLAFGAGAGLFVWGMLTDDDPSAVKDKKPSQPTTRVGAVVGPGMGSLHVEF
jgi:S1-C subfamily serine protease